MRATAVTPEPRPLQVARCDRLWDHHLYPYALLAPVMVVMIGLVFIPVGSAVNLEFSQMSRSCGAGNRLARPHSITIASSSSLPISGRICGPR